jgi:hypothetical protein
MKTMEIRRCSFNIWGSPFFHRVAPWFVEMITREENQQWAAADEINQQERETKKLYA